MFPQVHQIPKNHSQAAVGAAVVPVAPPWTAMVASIQDIPHSLTIRKVHTTYNS